MDAQYWRRHARQPVQFAESVRTLAELGCSFLMEIGPQPILIAAASRVWPESSATPRAIPSLRKGSDARRQIAEAVAAAYVAGHRPDFAAQHDRPGRKLELPTYPFQHRSYWPKTAGIRSDGSVGSGLLGLAQDLASGDTVYTSRLSVKTQPWLADHIIYGTVVVPGATYAAMAVAAVCRAGAGAGCVLLRTDHPWRQGLPRGAVDPASARRWTGMDVSRYTAVRTGIAKPIGR